jgi:amino acid adenylation domain-containing protein
VSTLEALAAASAQSRPDAPAVRGPDGTLTYGELDVLANRVAHALGELGVQHGDRVALWLPKGAAAVAATQGILRRGAAYVPIDPMSPQPRAQVIMDDCEVAAAVVEDPDEGLVLRRGDGAAAIRWADLETLPDAPQEQVGGGRNREDELAYILYTSGSTGKPKGVCISHRNALAFVEWAGDEVGVGPDDRLSNHAPLHFDLSVFDLYAAFRGGASVSIVPATAAYSPSALVELLRGERISVWYSVPGVLILMMERGGLLDEPNPALRAILFAGEPFPIKYVRTLRESLPDVRLLNWYGPTETNVCTSYEVREVDPDRTRPVPIGHGCSGDTVRAVKEDGAEAAVGERGELVCDGPTVMLGYWGRTPQGAEPYRTGDVVTRIGEDEYEYVARRDAMVKVRGYRIEPGEVEACLCAHPAIGEAAVTVEGEGMDRHLVAWCVAKEGRQPSLIEVKRHCAAALPRYMVVDRVRFMDELPRTSTGKLDRRRLGAAEEEKVNA